MDPSLKEKKSKAIFWVQVTLIFVVVLACIINLALETGRTEFWAGTMSACLGYILPAPSLTLVKDSVANVDVVDGKNSTTDNSSSTR
jgi:uncharacterized membrane protein